MRDILVSASKDYHVLIDGGLRYRAGDMIAEACGGDSAMLVTDTVVESRYADIVEKSLKAAGYTVKRFSFLHGERSKSLDIYSYLVKALGEAKLSRSDVVVALGGGVVGDIAGFAAATYLRGIGFAQMPTTLLAMVDSSIGGKTGLDLPTGKNQVGAFYQPDIVICDYEVLETLPDSVLFDGFAEMIKHGVILNAELFELLKGPVLQQIEELVALNVETKRDIVALDERDRGIRRILNFGHTIGHAIEKLSGYAVSHGMAVAVGMVATARGAMRMGLCGEDCFLEILEAVNRFGLASETCLTPEQAAEAAFFDKKRDGQSIAIILPEKIGKCIVKDFSMDEFAAFARLCLQE